MTDAHSHDARDVRRACVLMQHHARGDVEGLNALFAEIGTDDNPNESSTKLVLGLLALFEHLLPMVVTPLGQQMLASSIMAMAADEEPAP